MAVPTVPSDISFTDTQSVYNYFKAVTNYVTTQSKIHADKIFVSYLTNNVFKTLTYAEVDLLSTNLACEWSEAAKTSEVVSFISDHNVNYLIAMLAMMKLRVTMLAISPRNSEAAIINLLEKTQSKLIIASTKYEPIAKASASQVSDANLLIIDTAFDIETLLKKPLHPNYKNMLDTDFSDEDIKKTALIIHSSGSTAFPKPIYLSNRYLLNLLHPFHVNVNEKESTDKIDHNDSFLSCAPLEIGYALEYNKCTAMCATPIIYEQMIPYLKEKNNFSTVKNLKFAVYAGAPLKAEAGQWLYDHGLNIKNFYGTTEIGACMTANIYSKDSNGALLSPSQKDNLKNYYCVFESGDQNDSTIKHLYIRGDSPSMATGVSNRSDGGYDTNDLFKEDANNPGYYIHLGRRDDTLIMENGEKTNPVPMESTIGMHPIVKQVAVIGQARQCTAALIELNTEYAIRLSPEEIIAEVNEAVKTANKECPNHSVILPQMIKILPFDQTLPCTDKGNVMRKKSEALYYDVIEKLYKDFLEGPTKDLFTGDKDTSTWTEKEIEDFLINHAAKVLNVPASTFKDCNQSLFDHGLTSLTSIQLRNGISGYFGDVPQNFIFEHPSISSMSKALMNTEEENPVAQIEKRYQEAQELALSYVKNAKDYFPVSTNRYDSAQDKIVMLTGVTGSLGSFMLRDLLLDPSVKKVYAMIRGNPDQLKSRLIAAFESRFLDTSLLKDDRVEVLPMHFNEPFLGFTDEKYFELKNEVTIIQHCAWMLDFNMPVDHYDKVCIAPFYNLLKFAYRKVNPMHVHFISSISASAGYGSIIPEEPLPLDSHVTMPMGYAHSKFVVEILFNYLTTEKNFPCYIERLGQVCGDSVNGVWNISEQYPLMFVGGGSIMHKMPGLDTAIDWITVDYAAKVIVDIMLRTAYLPANKDQSVYHIVNPCTITWNDVLKAMKDAGMKFDVVSPSEWVDILSKDDTNPAFKLMGFYESNFREAFNMPIWETKKTSALTPLITKSPILDANLFSKFLTCWSSIGFYNPTI
ncbi:hypothetical protein INT48_007446 [Thamnidium elegans]|uniref:Carrier domain-containing protein n=1 Tax=Thamnidium elegans TaxID=101142 RepID=A0A8H7SS96_9FUNG|nr:hypothetical protein INT48_007446 [Thamnidium elegans]